MEWRNDPDAPSDRRTKDIVITAEGRDKGKRFHLVEMHAYQWFEWTAQATLAVSRSGGNVPASFLQAGMAGIVNFGLQALTACEWKDAHELMDRIFAQVKIKPDPNNLQVIRPIFGEDMSEATTIGHLFEEVLSLHLGFSLAEAGPMFLKALLSAISNPDLSSAAQSLQSFRESFQAERPPSVN